MVLTNIMTFFFKVDINVPYEPIGDPTRALTDASSDESEDVYMSKSQILSPIAKNFFE